jgi:acetolactate synthase-1/2/3 large subunit
MHLVDSLGKKKELEYVCCLHEQACAFAAEAYAEYTNDLGVVLVTAGPGGTNTLTGVAAAWIESSACLFISGQAKSTDMILDRGVRSMGQQELDIVSVVKPITKYSVTILEPRSIRYHLEKATYLAKHGRRGPVWIDIPLDMQAALIDESELQGFDQSEIISSEGNKDLRQQIEEALEILSEAERPVILAGNGVRTANAIKEFRKMIDSLRIPVLTTWKAADMLPESHDLFIGRPGAIGQRAANFAQQNSDCIFILGARLDLPQVAFNHRNFARAAKKIMVDIDANEIKKMQTEIHVPIIADVGYFIDKLLGQIDSIELKDYGNWIAKCNEWKRKYPVVLSEYWDGENDFVSTYVLIDVLSDQLTEHDVVVPGSSGPCSDILMQAFKVKQGQRVLNAPGLGAMGTGLPGAIGACVASGKRRTICVNGDGGFQLNIQELETVHRLSLPIKFFVLSNGGYRSIMAMQNNYFKGHFVASEPSSGLTLPNVYNVAKAFGLQVYEINSHSELHEKVKLVLEQNGPVVCVVKTSPQEKTSPRATSMQKSDGTIVSRPMEDMEPLLDRDEFLRNMIIPALDD